MNRVHDPSRNGFDHFGRRLERKREHTSFPRCAFDHEVSVHQAREIPADGQAQSRTGADIRVPLIERLEDPT
jgi:hypothetical protein